MGTNLEVTNLFERNFVGRTKLFCADTYAVRIKANQNASYHFFCCVSGDVTCSDFSLNGPVTAQNNFLLAREPTN